MVDKRNILFRNVHVVAVQGRPISYYVWMATLDQRKGLDVGAKTFQQAIEDFERETITTQIQGVQFISPLLDGSTDSAIVEQALFHVCFSTAGLIHSATKFSAARLTFQS